MDVNAKLAKLKTLMAKRDEIDGEIASLLGGDNASSSPTPSAPRVKKQRNCSVCGKPGHRATTCPQRPMDIAPVEEAQATTEAYNPETAFQ